MRHGPSINENNYEAMAWMQYMLFMLDDKYVMIEIGHTENDITRLVVKTQKCLKNTSIFF